MQEHIVPTKKDLLTTGSLSTLSKIFQLDIPSYTDPSFSYSHSGNEVLLTSNSGNYALIDYKNFNLKHESAHESSIRASTFLSSNFYSLGSDKFIQINDFDGREIHVLDDYNYFSSVGYLNYSKSHYLQTSLNSHGNLCYFDISIGKKAYTNRLKLNGFHKNTKYSDKVIDINGVTCIANCSGLRDTSKGGSDSNSTNFNQYNKLKNDNYNTLCFFSPKSRSPLAAINPLTKGSIKNITTTNMRNLDQTLDYTKGNSIEDIIAVLDDSNTLSFFDVRNYFEPFFKINIKRKFNTLVKQNYGNSISNKNFNSYNVNYSLKHNINDNVKRINNIENVKLLGDTILGFGFNSLFAMKLDFNMTEETDSDNTNILYTESFKERITNTSFCPYESVVGVTTADTTEIKFDSIVVPGIGKYWSSEVSTYDEFYPLYDKSNVRAKKDLEIKSLIHKLPANSIRLNIKEKSKKGGASDKLKENQNLKESIVKEYKQDKIELDKINKELKNVKVKRSRRKKMSLNDRKEIKKDDLRLKKQKVMEKMKEHKKKFKKSL